MIDLDALLQPVLDDAPSPPPFDTVRTRATTLHRRRVRRILGATLIALIVVGGAGTAIARRDASHPPISIRPEHPKPPSIRVAKPTIFAYPAMDMIFAHGSIWISQPDRVARTSTRRPAASSRPFRFRVRAISATSRPAPDRSGSMTRARRP